MGAAANAARYARYTLTPADREIVQRVARQRSMASRSVGVADKRHADRFSSAAIDLQGAAGELAFARIMKLRPRLDSVVRSRENGEDLDGDQRLADGRTVDVKTPMYNTPTTRLIVPRHNTLENSADLFALMLGSFASGEYTLAGFMPKETMLVPERLVQVTPRRPGDAYIAVQHELLPLLRHDHPEDAPPAAACS